VTNVEDAVRSKRPAERASKHTPGHAPHLMNTTCDCRHEAHFLSNGAAPRASTANRTEPELWPPPASLAPCSPRASNGRFAHQGEGPGLATMQEGRRLCICIGGFHLTTYHAGGAAFWRDRLPAPVQKPTFSISAHAQVILIEPLDAHS
jgi:hypothetical protein